MRKNNNTSIADGMDRRSALKTIGATSVGLLGVRTLSESASAKYYIPRGGSNWPVHRTEVSEEEFTWRHTSLPDRHGVTRKITDLTQEKPKDASGSEVLTTIHIFQVTDSRYTKETVERAGLNSNACYQQLNDMIKVTYPESLDPDKVHIRFRNDKDHVGGLKSPFGGDTDWLKPSTVPPTAISTTLRMLEEAEKFVGWLLSPEKAKKLAKIAGKISDVYLAIQLAKMIFKWGDTTESLGHKWDWPIPTGTPDRPSEQPWVRGRSRTSSWIKFDVIHNKNTPINFKIHNSSLTESGYGVGNEFEYHLHI